jgi:hypothetical protein
VNANESIIDHDQHPLMAALAVGLPITLLVDLVDPHGPRSREVFEHESPRPDAEMPRAQPGATARIA